MKDFLRLIKAGNSPTSAAQQLGIAPRSQSIKTPVKLSRNARDIEAHLKAISSPKSRKAVTKQIKAMTLSEMKRSGLVDSGLMAAHPKEKHSW